MRARTTILLSSAAGLLAAGAGAYVLAGDPEQPADPIRVSAVTAGGASNGAPADAGASNGAPADAGASNGAPAHAGASTQPAAGTEQLTGVLSAGDDPDDWRVADVDVDFGPEEWLLTNPEAGDLDGDGTTDPVLDELRALEGREVTLDVRYDDDDHDDDDRDDDGDRDDDDDNRDADAFTINGTTFRAPEGPAPWQNTGDSPEADRDTVATAAEQAIGDGAQATEVERTDEDGWEGWEAEVRAADGREHDVLLDAAGEVIDTRTDD
ncbi:PepSY domain-containing protein [Nocardiopsis sediminis]|uniref:PepSY domain-containing protein n=1 Tax=Nocardiopsis sediminis TaxID=1778267 RepID=A0ABV8FMI8_9ACTN